MWLPSTYSTTTAASKARGYTPQGRGRSGLITWRWTIDSQHTTCVLRLTKSLIIQVKVRITVLRCWSSLLHSSVVRSFALEYRLTKWPLLTRPTKRRLRTLSILLLESRGRGMSMITMPASLGSLYQSSQLHFHRRGRGHGSTTFLKLRGCAEHRS